MAHTTLASTDRALEKIGEFVSLQDYPSLKAVGRTFAQKAGVIVGLRRSIPKRYAKKAKRRLLAVNSHAKALGSLAEPYLLRALREDSSQGVRGAAAQWLGRIARHSDEGVRVRIYGVLVERFDAEARMMTLRAALAESCSHDMLTLEQHYPGRALTAAAVESSAARARDAEIAAFDASGRMGGVLELFDGGTGRPVRFVIERGTPSLLLDFKNTSNRFPSARPSSSMVSTRPFRTSL